VPVELPGLPPLSVNSNQPLGLWMILSEKREQVAEQSKYSANETTIQNYN